LSKQKVILEAKDCCAFGNQEGHADAIQHFLSTQGKSNVFQFSPNKEVRLDESPIISFNYLDGKWYAGRYVGESFFTFKGVEYHIVISPRFGNTQLYRMLEEVFNIRFSESNQKVEKQKDFQFIIKKIIAFLWLNMLSKANKHGLPRNNKKQTFVGSKIRGRLNVRDTIIPLKTQSKLVSNYWEKTPNEPITKILKQAYSILKYEYGIAHIKASHAASNALEQLFSARVSSKFITQNEYKNIIYKNIYKSYKPVVDLSWDIIKRKNFGNNSNSDTDGTSFFLDMAEIWELYLKNIIRKKLAPEGWQLRNDVIQTYAKKDFKRKLIPDIVFQKNNTLLVWDAKYKRMHFDYYDYDRSDYFQIHTYINYYAKNFEVIAGGLLYPLSKEYSNEKAFKNHSSSLFGEGKDNTQYIIDGIDLRDIDINAIKREENAFLNRMESRVKNKKLVTNEY
jgi:5-methylcytosine-specific restriction enzyme subunit McrC